MDWFQVTNIWTEKSYGKVAIKYRLEKIYLKKKSWWAPAGSPPPPEAPSLVKANRAHCDSCLEESVQVYEPGWICLNQKCQRFWQLGGRTPPSNMLFHPSFLAQRTLWPRNQKPPYDLARPRRYDDQNPALEYSLANWKGMLCPLCGRCNSRIRWDEWRCGGDGCAFVEKIKMTPLSHLSVMGGTSEQYTGQGLPFDKSTAPVVELEPTFVGSWRIQSFEIGPNNMVTHFTANRALNSQVGGAHDMFHNMQVADIGLQRYPLNTQSE